MIMWVDIMDLLLVFPGLTQITELSCAFSWQLGGEKVQDDFSQTIVSGALLKMPRGLGAFSVHMVLHHSTSAFFLWYLASKKVKTDVVSSFRM